jgi:hypothetical protein
MHFTLKQNPLREEHLRDFVAANSPAARGARAESERFRRFAYDDLIQRDKAGLDLICLRDESLEDMENLPPPDVIAQEIVEDLEAALAEFAAIAGASLRRTTRVVSWSTAFRAGIGAIRAADVPPQLVASSTARIEQWGGGALQSSRTKPATQVRPDESRGAHAPGGSGRDAGG